MWGVAGGGRAAAVVADARDALPHTDGWLSGCSGCSAARRAACRWWGHPYIFSNADFLPYFSYGRRKIGMVCN